MYYIKNVIITAIRVPSIGASANVFTLRFVVTLP